MPRNIRSRVEALEASSGEERPDLDPEAAESLRQSAGESWRAELEIMAEELASGCEPALTFRDGIFYTLDGRFAASPTEHNLAALWGPETMRQRESASSERWEEFLRVDSEASEFLSELEDLAEDADVPGGYETLLEGDKSRRLAWVLTNNPEARRLLAKICSRLKAFIS